MTHLEALDQVRNGPSDRSLTDGQYLSRKELELAKQIHESLLPVSFSHPAINVAVHYQPPLSRWLNDNLGNLRTMSRGKTFPTLLMFLNRGILLYIHKI